ncbi:zinc-dependent peptidase [Pseudogulbenkiania sp. MAI-1]|uniref:M90 family metallopeptidase n=1 Tax=Pseudogulbenkiania sp. MAI-1 TaxID=990370 RepID=UPI00045EAFED|nr:M90 family metallopeptidase [Pseudogulbenkiania sp. MAI-1]
MFFGFFGRRSAAGPSRAQLLEQAARMPLLAGLSADESVRLAALAGVFARKKVFSGAAGLTVTPAMVASVTLQMALPVMNLGKEALDGWQEIVLYPSAFVVRDHWMEPGGVVHEGDSVLIGQARLDGPVILSWPDVKRSSGRDGWNVVIHEIAHKLDMLNGDANGFPPLHKGMSREQWSHDWAAAYADFQQQLEREGEMAEEGWLDPYAAESPAEFFAVLSEAFFECPQGLAEDYPAVYRQLVAFYRQDTLARLSGLE